MAVVACRECGGKVSTKAASCPACGAARPPPFSFLKAVSWSFVGLVTLAVAWQCGTAMDRTDRRMMGEPSAAAQRDKERVAKEQSALAEKRLERERAFLAAGPGKIVAEMRRLVAAKKYEDAMKYGDAYFDVGDKEFRAAYEQASKGVEADAKRRAAVAAKKEGVHLGMTHDEVIASSWGKPRKINSSHHAWGTHEQWVYDGGYLYFENGVLTSVQN